MFGCRPKLQEEINPDAKAKLKTPSNYSPSPQLGGKINPYSMKNIREVKELFGYLSIAPTEETGEMTEEEKEMLNNLATMPIDVTQQKLYVSWQPNGKGQTENFADALKADTTIQIFPYPLDSTTYNIQKRAPDEEPSQYLENFRNSGKIYAIITPQQLANFTTQSTPQILDTLYFPTQEEAMLEVFAHLTTDNIDEQTMMTLASQYPDLYQEIHQLLKEGGFQGNKQKFIRRWGRQIIRAAVNIVRQTTGIFSVGISGISAAFGWGVAPSGNVNVQDDILGRVVPVVNVSVNVVHWGRVATGRTSPSGNYTINNTRVLFGSVIYLTFENQHAKIVPVDIRVQWILPSMAGAFTLTPAIHVVGFRRASDLANMQHNFLTHNERKYWCTILNSLHEYRTVASQRQINNPEKLLIWAVWANERMAASAPMFGHVSGRAADLFESVGILLLGPLRGSFSAIITRYLEAFLPDVIFTAQSEEIPGIDNSLTAHVKGFAYHEFAHTSHYFKVGPIYWSQFIGYTVGSSLAGNVYGSNINSQPGRFCALPEAWAQYMAYQVGMQYYPTQQFRIVDPLLPWVRNPITNDLQMDEPLRTLVEHAEMNEMFYRTFIPCGLFYDLMDVDTNIIRDERNYDRISGYTTKQIFDLMESNVQSMQEYKIRFERTYGSNADTRDLFQNYGLL